MGNLGSVEEHMDETDRSQSSDNLTGISSFDAVSELKHALSTSLLNVEDFSNTPEKAVGFSSSDFSHSPIMVTESQIRDLDNAVDHLANMASELKEGKEAGEREEDLEETLLSLVKDNC
jgi:hypothetical protein